VSPQATEMLQNAFTCGNSKSGCVTRDACDVFLNLSANARTYAWLGKLGKRVTRHAIFLEPSESTLQETP
jgi:hypothetical protein